VIAIVMSVVGMTVAAVTITAPEVIAVAITASVLIEVTPPPGWKA
jgi:hypothetical protein